MNICNDGGDAGVALLDAQDDMAHIVSVLKDQAVATVTCIRKRMRTRMFISYGRLPQSKIGLKSIKYLQKVKSGYIQSSHTS